MNRNQGMRNTPLQNNNPTLVKHYLTKIIILIVPIHYITKLIKINNSNNIDITSNIISHENKYMYIFKIPVYFIQIPYFKNRDIT